MTLEEKFRLLSEEVMKNMANPDLDLELCFPNEAEEGCEVKKYPYLRVKYVVEGHDLYEKEIDIEGHGVRLSVGYNLGMVYHYHVGIDHLTHFVNRLV